MKKNISFTYFKSLCESHGLPAHVATKLRRLRVESETKSAEQTTADFAVLRAQYPNWNAYYQLAGRNGITI